MLLCILNKYVKKGISKKLNKINNETKTDYHFQDNFLIQSSSSTFADDDDNIGVAGDKPRHLLHQEWLSDLSCWKNHKIV